MDKRSQNRPEAGAALRDYIDQVVAQAPPLTAAQRDKLAGLLRIEPRLR